MSRGNRLRIVVLGFLIREPTGGLAWHYLNYVRGLADLGHDVYYVEDSGDEPMCYDPQTNLPSSDPTVGLRFAGAAFGRLGLDDRWAYFDAHTNRWLGPRAHDAAGVCASADIVLHVSGWNPLRDWLCRAPARVLIDTDPGFTQLRNLKDPAFRARTDAHTGFFSFGANIGTASSAVPADGIAWQPTRQPIWLAGWPMAPSAPGGRFSTVMDWHSYELEHQGMRLLPKSGSFPAFAGLPQRVGDVFELAVRGGPEAELRRTGWRLADLAAINRSPWHYQAFIQRSKAEFGIAKHGYVATNCGWFSERSAGYLASGRPVLHQDTGFSEWLPCGEGVLAFRSLEEAAEGIARIDADYPAHRRAARAVAEEYFAAARILPRLLEAAATTPGHR